MLTNNLSELLRENNSMKKITLIFLMVVLIIPAFAGCNSIFNRRVTAVSPNLLDDKLLDKKIQSLAGIIEKGDLSADDRERALNILDSYRLIRNSSTEELSTSQYRRIIRAIFRGLINIDEEYFSRGEKKLHVYALSTTFLTAKIQEVRDAYLDGDYKGVINKTLKLKTVFGPDALNPETGILFALSLAEEGMTEEAIKVGEAIASEIEGRPDLISLRAGIAKSQLRLGMREKALLTYEKLTDNVDEREAILQSVRKDIASKTDRESIKTFPQTQLRTETGDQTEFMKIINRLIREQKFKEARALLALKREQTHPGPEFEVIDQGIKRLDKAEKKFLKEELSKISRKEDVLSLAKKYIEEERFEEAVSKLEDLEKEQGKSNKTQELKRIAIEKLINKRRNQAARLYLMAKKTEDRKKKREYLSSSYKILQVLIDKYPASPLYNKVISNIDSVKQELDLLR